jgi:hypothetical protein
MATWPRTIDDKLQTNMNHDANIYAFIVPCNT